jgi:hypothetical protein
MPTITNKVQVLAELKQILEKLPQAMLESAEVAMRSTVDYLHGKVPQYPPTLEDQTYIRTGTLGRKITEAVTRDEHSVTGEMGLNTPYAPWVVGPDFPGEDFGGKTMYQAKIHEKRWWQLDDIYSAIVDGMWQLFQEEFFPELRKRFAALR